MSIFDTLGLKPGQGVELAVQRELELRRATWTRGGYHYQGAGDFLLQTGQFYRGRVLPDEYANLQGNENECFWNALAACEANPELRYCEGVYALAGHFTPHGWAVAPDGGVLEVTFPTRGDLSRYVDFHTKLPFPPIGTWGYYGTIFRPEFVRWHEEVVGEMCMLDRPAADPAMVSGLDMTQCHDFPVLKVPYDPQRVSL